MLTSTIFGYLREKNLIDLEEYFKKLDPILFLQLPQLVDKSDGGKSLIHKCAQVKSDILLETIVETYRRKYVQVMLENANEKVKNESSHMKQVEREAKNNIRDWCNQVTDDDNGFFAIHFACFVGHS